MSYRPQWNGRSGYSGKRKHMLRNILLGLLAACVLLFAALEVYIGVHSRTKIEGEPQVMVIFGCQVRRDGPSILLRDRLDTALAYLEDHPNMKIVVTGGKGDDEHISEAQCMYDYLTAHGVDGENIYMEDQARNTWENVTYTRHVLCEDFGMPERAITGDYLLVSNGFHLSRIRMLWDRGMAGTYTVSTLAAPVSHMPSAVQMFFREPLALVKSFFFDR